MKCFGKRNLSLFLLIVLVFSCEPESNLDLPGFPSSSENLDTAVVVDWFALIKTLTTETPGYTPPVAARAFGYTGVALYEGLVPSMPTKQSLSGQLNGLEITIAPDPNATYHWPTVANAVLGGMTRHFYANANDDKFEAIVSLEKRFNDLYLDQNGAEIHEASLKWGQDLVAAVLEWSSTDGGANGQLNNFPAEYMPPVGPQFWVPTPPNYQPALQPYWGDNRPFLTQNIGATAPQDPVEFSTAVDSEFYSNAMNVYTTVNSLTPAQRVIAEYWSDDPVTTATPPGHSISILNQLIVNENVSLQVAAEAYAKLGIGISDAFISCWNLKYKTMYVRPITYIQAYIDPDWNSVLVTPPFPEFTSGHSVQSGALAEIMTDLFGENYTFTDTTHAFRTDIDGSARTYASFYALAEEAAISRLYGGIHYMEAIYGGLEQGYQIGRNVNALQFNK